VASSQRLGRHRWRIERTIAWLLGWRRLRVRDERSDERCFTFAMLACSAWKTELVRFVAETGLEVTVCQFPLGTSSGTGSSIGCSAPSR
jgi:hypothetical protein